MTSGTAAILATGDLDEFQDPPDAADERIVPFLEINLRLGPPTNQRRNVAEASFIAAPSGKTHHTKSLSWKFR